jgi:mono/diheme cytochrome c family protein
MPGQLPTPDFDDSRYERPNDAWVCGHHCAGKPCPLGPSPDGKCQTTAECRPFLELKSGEAKGRWRCTRPKEHGGPCEDGPRPDGGCSHPVIPCAPRRSLRRLRGRFTLGVCVLLLALLLVALGGRWRWRFINPGPLTPAHASQVFAARTQEHFKAPNGCAGCHAAAAGGLTHWVESAVSAQPAPWSPEQFTLRHAGPHPMTGIDRHCAVCHPRHERHQPSVTDEASCSSCHVEHRGTNFAAPSDDRCAECHNQASVMAAASVKGHGLASRLFDPPVPAGVRVHSRTRPAGGRTNLFASFWNGHPEFAVLAQGQPDPTALRFNHAVHLGETVRLDGRAVTCADCHAPDPTGAYMTRVSFAQHCRGCHGLQIDPQHPDLTMPHGDITAVRAALRGLPLAYTELARRAGLSARAEVDRFAQTNLARLRQLFGSGEALERLVLHTADPRPGPATLSAGRKAHFAGCAYCHTVTEQAGEPRIAPVTPPDRWLVAGRFNHARHTQVNCEHCHAVGTSRQTSDILLPSQQLCVTCHQPSGGAPANCAACHSYHLLVRP